MVFSDHCQKRLTKWGRHRIHYQNTVLDFALRIRNMLIVSVHFMSCAIHHWVRDIESYDSGVLVYFCSQCCKFLPCVF